MQFILISIETTREDGISNYVNTANLFINSIFDTTVTADLKSNSESLLEEIDKIYEDLYEKHQHYLGYPFNLNLEYAEFGKFLNLQPTISAMHSILQQLTLIQKSKNGKS